MDIKDALEVAIIIAKKSILNDCVSVKPIQLQKNTKTIYNGNLNKKVSKNNYGEIKYQSDYDKHIKKMLSDDWEGDEEIFVSEDECSKPFNTPKILGCDKK